MISYVNWPSQSCTKKQKNQDLKNVEYFMMLQLKFNEANLIIQLENIKYPKSYVFTSFEENSFVGKIQKI